MIKWTFKPTISAIDLVLIVVWAKFLIPTMGLWSLIPVIILFCLIDYVEQFTWIVMPYEQNEIDEITEAEADLELIIPYLKDMAERGDDEARLLLYTLGESDDFKNN